MDVIDQDVAARIAHAFVTARAEKRALPDYPGPVPTALSDGYRVQDVAMTLAEQPVGGWKVGKIAPPLDGVDRLVGPIFTSVIVQGGDQPLAMPVFADGFAAAEAEFLLRVGQAPDPAKTSYTHEEAAALIDAVHVGIEIASSPFPGINTHGAPVTVSDFGNNNGLIVGAAVPDWREAGLNDRPVETLVNGEVVGSATAATMLDGPIGAARFLFEVMAARGIALRPGQWISSGAVTGVHPVKVGDVVEARFGSGYSLHCTISAA